MAQKLLTFEDVVNVYVSELLKFKGIEYSRRITNYEKYDKNRKYFELAAQKINSLNGLVDLRLFCRALTKRFGGFYCPSELTSQSSFRIYREYIATTAPENQEDYIISSVKESLKFLITYFRENGINNMETYLKEYRDTTPTFIKHIYSGSLSWHFIACFDDFIGMLSLYPNDIVAEFLPDARKKYVEYRVKVLGIQKLKTMTQSMRMVINQLILKGESMN